MESNKSCKLILDSHNCIQKMKRMALQILEDHYSERKIVLIGIEERGYELAQRLNDILLELGDKSIELIRLSINKKLSDQSVAKLDTDVNKLTGESIIIVDDVANTGRVLTYSLKPFLNIRPKQLRTLALVDRKHKLFPVSVDYVGLSLSTTMKEHIEVSVQDGAFNAYLC